MLRRENLHKYQEACITHIINNRYCGLFLDMGLGKTVTTLTAIDLLIYDYLEINKVLIIAPKRVTETVWAEEAKNWEHLKYLTFSKIVGNEKQRLEALHAKANIYLISRDNIAWLCAKYGGGRTPFDMVVVDELSSFKSYKSQRFKALRQVRPTIKRFVGLTGTPAPNGLIDLWPQIWLMDMGLRLGKTITSYRRNYFSPAQTNGHIVYSYRLNTNAEKLIRDNIADICISMKAEDYLEMPMLTENYISLTLPSKIKKQYDNFEKEKILELNAEDTINVINAAGLSNKLLQFANGSIYDEDRNVHEVHDIKLEALKEIVDTANGQSILVAWTYQFDRDRILKALSDYKPRELKGANDINEWNEGKIQVMLAHPASAGHGLNLQAGGSIIVWFGLTWSLELYQQFNARLYRQGQKERVIIHHLVMQGTHDEDVVKALKQKNKTQESLLNSIKAKINKYLK